MLTVEMKEGRGQNRWNDGGSKVQEEVLSGTSETGCEEHMGGRLKEGNMRVAGSRGRKIRRGD